MKCKEITRSEEKVFIIDSNDSKLEVSDVNKLCKYESENSLEFSHMINEFLGERENKYINLIEDIESMIKKYNIDYFSYAECGGYPNDIIGIIQNINNRKSTIDCILKVFYNKKEKLKFMISFNKGSSGSVPGYEFYLHFGYESYSEIRCLIEEYFKLDDDSNGEIKLLDSLYAKIRRSIINYYI